MPGKKPVYGRKRADSGQHRRILIAAAILSVIAFIPISIRLYDLMIVQYETYRQLALNNQTRTTAAPAQRGTIYDTNMNVVAYSESVHTVYLNPRELRQAGVDMEETGEFLSETLQLDKQWIIDQSKDYALRYKKLKDQVPEETADRLLSYINEHNIKGIHLEPGTKRVYPYKSLASQVVGFVNSSDTGSEGVEAAYNSYLSGKAGKVITTKGNNEMDMPFSYEAYAASRQGSDVVLTLDMTVQAILEKQMQAAMDRYDVQNGAFGLVMKVKTGEILAMATLGGYDPNAYLEIYDEAQAQDLEQMRLSYLQYEKESEGYLSGKTAYQEALQKARLKQWRNRCISDGYEPGSTFKVMTLAAALDCGAISLNNGFYCGGSENIPGRSQLLHCWRSTGHGSQQTPQALQNSCNIAFAHIALSLGGERFYEYVKKFGVLEKTGIDLAGESKGVFFDKSLVVDTDKWGTASLTSGSFGQTFKLTPLQLVRAISAVVNGGELLEPYVVSQVTDAEGKVLLQQEKTVLRQVISPDTSKTMCELLTSVVTEGTAKNAQVYGFSIGGKTGTSEKIDVLDESGNPTLDKIVSFVGVAPMDNPEYIVLVALDTPSRKTGIYISGGVMGAPTVGAVMADILPYLGVEANYPEEDAAGQQVAVPDFTGMTQKEAQETLKKLGITGKLSGTAPTVTGQLPSAGSVVAGDSQMLLYFGNAPQPRQVTLPSFLGLTRQQAADLAGSLGIYILPRGNETVDGSVVVIAQSHPEGAALPAGSTVTLTFGDTTVAN